MEVLESFGGELQDSLPGDPDCACDVFKMKTQN